MTHPVSRRNTLVRTVVAASLGAAFLLASPADAADRDLVKGPAAQQPDRIGHSSVTKSSAKKAGATQSVRGEDLAALSTLAATTCGEVTIAPGASPAGGYLPLSLFGIPPISGVGDDTVTEFSVPSYRYAGQAYSQLQVSSNGYVQAGGTANNSLNNQNFPDPTVPNNTLAAFWTDLNPAAAGEMRIGTLTDGNDTWIVVDWAGVREFSTAGNTHSFEIWIGVDSDANPGQDVSYAYGANTGNGDGGLLSVGAENVTGTSGGNTYFNGTGTLPTNGTQLQVTDPGGGPTADFTATPTSGPAPLHVEFDASASTDNGSIASYDWDFGDSSTGSGQTTDHDYAAGVYTASLTVTDNDGNACTASEEIGSEGAFSVNDVTINEGAGTATFTVTRPGGPAASVDVATVPGTARTPADYSAAPATLSFAAGETSKAYGVSINQDSLDEFAESYSVRLSNAVFGTVADGTGIGTILDDDAVVSLRVSDNNVTEGDTGTKPLAFRVSLNRVSGKTVRVTFQTANGSAVASSDYISKTVVVTFTPGQRAKTVNVDVVGDRRKEPNEAFFALLNNPANATIADPNGTGGIIDND